jgi:capsular exopolysaccharide synthesis family protein
LSALPQIGPRRKAQPHEFVPARQLKDGPLDAYAESLRTLRGALDLCLRGEANRVIMVTSSVPSEGKTSIVVALATSIACAGQSVVVVELDLRRPAIGKQLGISSKPGILEFMAADSRDLKDYITYLDDLKISLMVANGSINDSPTVLACPKLAQALDALASRFDYVILDTPPLGPIIDSRLIANISTGIIFVVKWGDTPHEVASQNLRQLVGTKARVLGVALNAMDLKQQKLYSRYGDGYYHSRYAAFYRSHQRSAASRNLQGDGASDDGVQPGVTGPQLRCSDSKDRHGAGEATA